MNQVLLIIVIGTKRVVSLRFMCSLNAVGIGSEGVCVFCGGTVPNKLTCFPLSLARATQSHQSQSTRSHPQMRLSRACQTTSPCVYQFY